MPFDHKSLEETIYYHFNNEEEFAEAVHIPPLIMRQKLLGEEDSFTVSEILRCAEALELDPPEIRRYFFTPKEVRM